MPSRKPSHCPLRSRFGGNVARLRRGAGITQERLAEMAGISARYLQSVEAGEYFPAIRTLAKLASSLGCGWEELFRGVGSPTPRHAARGSAKPG